MAEVLGLVASIITISHTLKPAVQQARTFFKAEKELDELQDDLEKFTGLLAEINYQILSSCSSRLKAILLKSQHTIEQLNCIIQQKLLKHKGGKNQARHRSWLRHKAKVTKLQSILHTMKDDLLATVNVSSLASSNRSEAILSNISRDTIVLKDVSSKLDKKVEFMHQDILDASRTVSLHTSAMLSMLSSMPETRSFKNMPTQSAIPYRGFPVETLESSNPSITKYVDTIPTWDSIDKISTANEQRCCFEPSYPQPASFLELSPNFLPEAYTNRTMIPKVVIAAFWEESSSLLARTNRYRVLYFQSPRRWVLFDVSLEIPRSSIYWTIARISRRESMRSRIVIPFCISASLRERLQRGLEKLENIKENAHIRLRLLDDNTGESDTPRVICNALPKSSEPSERAILSSLRHLGCPRYSEDEVVQIAPLELPERFVACFNGKLVEEVKSPNGNQRSDFLYNIQLLHCLRGTPGIARFVGLTFDKADHLKSYLLKLPDSKCELLLHRASNLSSPCSWQQIEDWSRQLIQRINAVHTRGYVVGTLWWQRPPILIDAFERLHLWRFESRIYIRSTASPFYPPEYRHYAKLWGANFDESEVPLVTPEFDIYQLGLLLWILAKSWSSGESALFVKEEFYKPPASWHGGLYTGPDPLPRLPDTIPVYYRDVISTCCAGDPFDRPSTEDLLSKFPSISIDTESNIECDWSPEPMDINAMRGCRAKSQCCDHCWKQIFSKFYICTICDEGDFDVCLACFKEGKHCDDQTHLLVEVDVDGNFPVATRYYSSVDSSGQRSVTEH